MKFNKIKHISFFTFLAVFCACTNIGDFVDIPSELSTNGNGSIVGLPYSESFAGGFGAFTQISVKGEQKWEHDSKYKYAFMSGAVKVADKKYDNFENEDWMISSEIDLSGVSSAKMSFESYLKYFKNLKEEANLYVSTDYTKGEPNSAEWTKLTIPQLKESTKYEFNKSGQIDLTAFAGKKIRIAFKYISTTELAGTWRIKNLKVEEGGATEDGDTDEPANEIVTGEGSEDTPYSIGAAKNNQGEKDKGKKAWVEGYIVGSIAGKSITTGAKFEAPFEGDTNILIAESNTEKDYKKCLVVQLPKNAVRKDLNLKDNPANLGKKVKIYGDLEPYFKQPGLKKASKYKF